MAFAVAGTLLAPAAQAAAGPDFSKIWQPPDTPLPDTTSVNVTDVAKAAAIAPHYPVPRRVGKTPAPAPTQRESATVELSGAQLKTPSRAGKLPVWMAPKPGAPAVPQTVTVVQSDERAAHAAGVNGLLFTLTAQPQSTPAAKTSVGPQQPPATPVLVALDVAALNAATGGEFASRGRLVTLPACAATTPNRPPARSVRP